MGWDKAKISLTALGIFFLNACGQENTTPLPENAAGQSQAKIELDKAEFLKAVGERHAEEYALSRGHAISVTEADQIVGKLYLEYRLVDIPQMTRLAEVIQLKSTFGSPDIMSRPDYERIKQDRAYVELSQSAKDKLNELILPKLGF